MTAREEKKGWEEENGMLDVAHLDALLFLSIGILAIVNALIPDGSWRSISLLIGVITVVRAALKWTSLSKKHKA